MAKQIKTVLTLDNKQYNSAIKSSQAQTSKFEKSSVASAGLIRNAFVALGGAAVIRSVGQTAASFQDLQNSLNVVFGSVDAGAAAFERVQGFAATTQFSVQTLTQAFVQLKGAGVEPTEELLQTFADTASVTTDQMGTFQAALDLVSRSTAGGLGLEDLNRLADRGIPVFNILQDRLGLARLELSEFGKTADGARRITAALLDGLQENFGGALSSQVGLINFELNQLGDAADKFKVALFSAVAGDAGEGIRGLTNAVNRLADNMDGLVSTIKIVGAGFIAIRLLGKDVAKIFITLFDKTKALLTGTGQLAKNFTTLKDILALLRTGIAGLGIRGLIAGVIAAIAAFAPWAAAIAAVAFGLFELGKVLGIFGKDTEKVTEAVKNNAHVLAFQAEQERLAKIEAEKLAEKTRLAALAAEAFQRGFDNAKKSVESFKKEVFDTNDPLSNYQEFLSDLISTSNDLAVEQVFAGRAMAFLTDLHERGAIATRTYEIALDRLNGILGITVDKVDEDTESFDAFNDVVENIAKNTDNYNMLLERLIELQTLGLITSEQYKEALANLNTAFTENEGINNFLDTLGRAQKSLSEDLAQAFMDGESAGDSFQKFFKKMIKQIIADIIRLSIIQPILGAIMAPFGFGFGTGGNVIKIPGKASGGPVMANQPYIVGEKGPELFVPGGNGNIVPNGQMGGTSVNYTINAVDSQSFEMALARDPSFVFAVTEAGRRKMPGRV